MAGVLMMILVFGLVFGSVFIGIVSSFLASQRRNRVLSTGVPARGLILEINKLGTNVTLGGMRYESRYMRVDVEMDGHAPYEIRCRGLIPKMMVRNALPGTFVALKVDPRSPKDVAVVGPGGVYFAD